MKIGYICVCCSVLLLVAVALRSCTRRVVKKGGVLLIGESEDDVRDNVLNYDEQGGGEEDEVRMNQHQLILYCNSGLCRTIYGLCVSIEQSVKQLIVCVG